MEENKKGWRFNGDQDGDVCGEDRAEPESDSEITTDD